MYDELGALEKKRIGGKRSSTTPTASTFLQEAQYKYNIRGWLTEVNNASNLGQLNNGKSSLFALKLNYNKSEQGLTGVKALYNGNISEQIWTSAIDNKKRGYGYVYDGANRLVLGSFKAPDLNSASTASLFDEKLEYDKNGNILKLDRNGASLAGVPTVIDKLTYSYESGSNRLSTVRDASGNQEGFKQGNTTGADYAYDDFGNLTSDKHKKITKIKYNHLNLPVEINFGTDKIEYLYTASGEKTQKKVTEKGVVTLTDYLGGFQYVKGKLSFLPTAEGFFNAETNAYVYQYKDHLGNVRLSYSDKSGDNTIQSSTEIIEETNYYPFGLAHKGYNQKNDALMKDYKYQYNGKEKQEELGLNFYDYGARNYDAAIGRWMNVDPLAEKYPSISPYAYVANNPIIYIDPDGREIIGVKKKDAQNFKSDIHLTLADKKFDGVRALIDVKGSTFKSIDAKALSTALNGVTLSADERTYVDMVTNTINSTDVHKIEYMTGSNTSSDGATAFKDHMNGVQTGIGDVMVPNGQLSTSLVEGLGKEGFNLPTKNGSHSFISSNVQGNERASTSGHEVFGHGIPSAKGLSPSDNNANAIRTDNLIRRILGMPQRDGKDHGGYKEGHIKAPQKLPITQ